MKKLLMTHFYYGDPNQEFSLQLAKTLVDAGADILEIGIPYTDPVCDGAVFQRACKRALERGINPFDVLEGIRKMRKQGIHNPIYLTSYYGPIFKIGVEKIIKLAADAKVTGLIVPDILLEEQAELRNACDKYNLSLIQFATVYSSKERLEQIISASTDFIYCVSLPGVTGDKPEKSKLLKLFRLIKKMTDKKILVGFGIRSKDDVQEIISYGADGVIVGSAITQIYEKYINEPEKSLNQISSFVKDLKESTIEI